MLFQFTVYAPIITQLRHSPNKSFHCSSKLVCEKARDVVICPSRYALIDPDKKNCRVPPDGNKPLTMFAVRLIDVGGLDPGSDTSDSLDRTRRAPECQQTVTDAAEARLLRHQREKQCSDAASGFEGKQNLSVPGEESRGLER